MPLSKEPHHGALERALVDAYTEAAGRGGRNNPVVAGTGGPAGNALLTAWTALVLLVLSVAELLTLFNVRGLLSWHVALGALLIPPAGMKTASTGWRMVRYYRGNPTYRRSGPPPMLLRLLGPLVVASTLGLLGTGVLLVVLGEERSRQSPLDLAGWRVDWVTAHQALFAVWVGAVGPHLLGRIVPAVHTTMFADRPVRVPGRWTRILWFVVMTASAAAIAVVLVHADGSWH
ncbi:MAG: hypothetical protein ABIO16_00980 [Nocardioides sp.]